MNTNIAICGRPEPSEPCNHTANPFCQPVKIAPTAKLIPWNEITAKSRPQPWQSEAPSLGAAEENSALICFYRCLPAGILFFFRPDTLQLQAWTRGTELRCSALRFWPRLLRKKSGPFPKLNSMPDRPHGVKVVGNIVDRI